MAFYEEEMLNKAGFHYTSIPFNGKESYNTKTLTAFGHAINNADGKVLVYCKNGGRATCLMMAFHIK